jgi:hypothetical protein
MLLQKYAILIHAFYRKKIKHYITPQNTVLSAIEKAKISWKGRPFQARQWRLWALTNTFRCLAGHMTIVTDVRVSLSSACMSLMESLGPMLCGN